MLTHARKRKRRSQRAMRMPRWHERTLWSAEHVLDGLSEAHWAGFTFTLPLDGLDA